MATITENYVSFEIAKLLNIKGFKGEFHKHYWGYEPGKEFLTESSFNSEYDYPAPTLQMAMKWLREVHNIFIENCITRNRKGGIDHWCKVNTINDFIPMSNKYPFNVFIVDSEDSRSSYEKACEAAIKYCLENLI